jgi:hypothetical protein
MTPELPIISDCYDMNLEVIRRVEKFPRHHRYTMGKDLEQRSRRILELLIRAKYQGDRRIKGEMLNDVNTDLQVLRFELRLAKDAKALPLKGHEYLAQKLENLGSQVGGWMKSIRNTEATR